MTGKLYIDAVENVLARPMTESEQRRLARLVATGLSVGEVMARATAWDRLAKRGKCAGCAHFIGRRIGVPDGWGYCQLAYSSDGAPKHQTLAFASDGEGWSANLAVSPEYGCVQFAKKEE